MPVCSVECLHYAKQWSKYITHINLVYPLQQPYEVDSRF